MTYMKLLMFYMMLWKQTRQYDMDDLSKFKEELDGLHDDETSFNSRFEQLVS